MVMRPLGRSRQQATTLVELMVVLCLFSLIMTVILSFYIEAGQVTRRQDIYSDAFRRTLVAADRIEALIHFSRLYEVSSNTIVFAKMNEVLPIAQGMPNWQPQASTIFFNEDPPSLEIIEDGRATPITPLQEGDKLRFSQFLGTGGSIGGVTIAVSTDPTVLERKKNSQFQGKMRNVSFSRSILVENVEVY